MSVAGGPMRPGSPLPPGSASTHSTPSTSRRRSRIYIGDYHQNRDRDHHDHHDHHDHCDHQPPLPQLPLTLLQLCTTSLTPCHPTSETKNLLNLEKSIYPKKGRKIHEISFQLQDQQGCRLLCSFCWELLSLDQYEGVNSQNDNDHHFNPNPDDHHCNHRHTIKSCPGERERLPALCQI